MRLARSVAVLLLSLLAGALWAAPEVLIAQTLLPKAKEGADPNVQLTVYLASELETDGRVVPIVWSMTDPVYRAYVDEGRIPAHVANPTLAQVNAVAAKLHIRYVMMVVGQRHEKGFFPRIELYRTGSSRAIWHYGWLPGQGASAMIASTDGVIDWESTAQGTARLWTETLAVGPFKDHSPRPRKNGSEPVPGESLVAPQPKIAPVDTKAVEKARESIKAGKLSEAILLLRESIDAEPFEADRRVLLAKTLLDQGLAVQAAEEARRASPLVKDQVELRLMAARAWLLVSDDEKAQVDLNEALARGAKGSEPAVIEGDLFAVRGDYAKALAAYDKALEAGPRFDAVFGRAIAHAMLGDADAATKDLKALPQSDPEALLSHYSRAVQLIDRSLIGLSDELRNLPQLARLAPKSAKLIARATDASRRATALSMLIGSLPTPARHAKSHVARDLAHKLLAQASLEVLDFVTTADDDLGTEAAMSLGEALKLFPAVREVYDVELRYSVVAD